MSRFCEASVAFGLRLAAGRSLQFHSMDLCWSLLTDMVTKIFLNWKVKVQLVRRNLLVPRCNSVTWQLNSELDRKVDPLGTNIWLPRMSIIVVIVGDERENA